MKSLNTGRFIAAGLAAGVAINVFDGILYAWVLAADSAAVMAGLGLEEPSNAAMGLFVLMAFVMGFAAVWLYTGVRERLGPGPVTAVKTGLAVWALAYLVPFVGNTLQGMATPRMFWIGVAFTVFSVPLATVIGAWVYRDAEAAPAAAAPAEPMTHSRDE